MSRFSRRTIIAAIDVLDRNLTQADTSRFLLKAGSEISGAIGGEEVSVRKRMNDLMKFVDDHPAHPTDDGPLEMVIVEEAVALLPPDRSDTLWSGSSPLAQAMDTFRRVLQKDGFVVADKSLRPVFPTDIGLHPCARQLGFGQRTAS